MTGPGSRTDPLACTRLSPAARPRSASGASRRTSHPPHRAPLGEIAAEPAGDRLTGSPGRGDVHPDAAGHRSAHAIGVGDEEAEADLAAHRVADVVDFLELQMVEQVGDVLDHLSAIALGVVWLVAPAVATKVEADDAPAGPRQRVHPARAHPVDLEVAGEAMDEDGGMPFFRPLEVVMEANPSAAEVRHLFAETTVRFRLDMAKLDLQLVQVATGKILAETLEKPRTFVGRGIGLMFRGSLPARHGMLIDPCNGINMLFMRFPIDALFLDRLDRVKKIYRRVQPWYGVVWLVWGAHKVVELPAGSLEAYNLPVGEQLEFARPR